MEEIKVNINLKYVPKCKYTCINIHLPFYQQQISDELLL